MEEIVNVTIYRVLKLYDYHYRVSNTVLRMALAYVDVFNSAARHCMLTILLYSGMFS